MSDPITPTRSDYREAMHTVIRAAVEVMTLAEVGAIFGVTRERIRQIAPVGHRRRVGPPPMRLWELPNPRDRRHIRELMALGMTAREAVELVGYLPVGKRVPGGSCARLGTFTEDQTWRGWKTRTLREIQKLIAADAIRKGAYLREAAEVSGLPANSVGAWSCTGVLPRSRHPQGGASQRGRRRHALGTRYAEAARLWNTGLTGPEVAARMGIGLAAAYQNLARARAAGLEVEKRGGNCPISKRCPITEHYHSSSPTGTPGAPSPNSRPSVTSAGPAGSDPEVQSPAATRLSGVPIGDEDR